MMIALSEGDRERLAKLLGLLGSEHVGERAAAGAAAHKLVKQRGWTWFDILEPQIVEVWREPPSRPPPPLHWRVMAARCLLYPRVLSAWERGFLKGLSQFPSISEKQLYCLERIADRVLGADDR